MPSPIAHLSIGYVIYRVFRRRIPADFRRLFNVSLALIVIMLLSVIPDFDFFAGLAYGDIGKYHNNLTHSLFVGVFIAFFVAGLIYWRYRAHFWLWFTISLIAYNLHPILDLFVGERGVMLFWPFTEARFLAPIQLFYGVQWGLGWISPWHLVTIISELFFFLVVFFIVYLLEKKFSASSPSAPDE
ncbi:MAG: metal-dependent hydrolase [Anaerolineales bacterium]|nr:metal-dependent hydrolase [Anaerolineales bacterium]